MILGLDAGSRTVTEAEHLLHDMVKVLGLPAGTVGCTHFVRTSTGVPHVACSLALLAPVSGIPETVGAALGDSRTGQDSGIPVGAALGDSRTGPDDLAEGAALAAAEHAAGAGGRLVLFPGHDGLNGTLTVAEVLAGSSIEQVVVLAQTEDPSPDTLVVTNDHVRPQWRDGRVILLTMPASGGRLMPAEVPNPTPCCVDHG
ncbi:hypothetical protein AB0B89_20620 [Sphaerisporangium sp. NPDC049002]|uniref:hypothetical protein n=1 Tax=unclassified Sphaerisporangium TaxID=2630420 RepID=UPI0033EAF9E3